MTMTEHEHQERHKELHHSLDEIFSDFITNSGTKSGFTQRPIIELITWSYKQSLKPDHTP